jgi:putative addiction module CopG family antidote
LRNIKLRRKYICPDFLEVENPGILLPGMTIEDMKSGVSKISNPVIARAFRELKLIEAPLRGKLRLLAVFAIRGMFFYKPNQQGGNSMATLNISMPDEMRAFIEARVNMGEYQSASDYLRDLIRHDREETERLLVEGLDSGTARPLDMTALRKKAQSLLKQKKAL